MAFSFSVTSEDVTRGTTKTKEEKDHIVWSLRADTDGRVTLQNFITFVNSAMVRITDEVLGEELRKGFPKDYVVNTDGVLGRPYQQVNIARRGIIDISAQQDVSALVEFIFRSIEDKSKVFTGRYKQSHVMLYNRKEVASTTAEAVAWAAKANIKGGDFLQFINFQPYARKLERLGVTAQRSRPRLGKVKNPKKNKNPRRISFKPNGAYYLTALLASKVFGKFLGRIKFEFIPGESGLSSASDIPRSTFVKDGRPYLYPSILVVFDNRGIS